MSSSTHKTVRAVVDYGGLAVFAVGFLLTRDLVQATWWLVAGSALSLAVGFAVEKRVAPMPLIAGGAALLFGVLTLVFHNPAFIKAKPTVVNLLFAAGLLGGLAIGKNPLKMLLGESLTLSDRAWRSLSIRYGLFFIAMAGLNLVVWLKFSDAVWVFFRFPGLAILAVAFSLTQVPFMMKHMKDAEAPPPPVD
ncbi:MAG TPA: inner membrane-spanning protein YciB [Caulobacteraceae bacterium]